MESVPSNGEPISGIVQSGYSCGYLLAALAAKFVLPFWEARDVLGRGVCRALLAFYIRFKVTEFEAWKQHPCRASARLLRPRRRIGSCSFTWLR